MTRPQDGDARGMTCPLCGQVARAMTQERYPQKGYVRVVDVYHHARKQCREYEDVAAPAGREGAAT